MNLRLVGIFLLLGSSCCASHVHEARGAIPKAEALSRAKREFAKLYPERVAQYDVRIIEDSEDDVWSVWFEGQGEYAVPGGYTRIDVNRTTGKTQVFPSD